MAVTEALLDLQSIDVAIDRLITRRDALDAGGQLAAARAAADEAERVLGEFGLAIDSLDRDATKLEHEIDSLTQKATAERSRMSDGSVANARELASIGREVENLDRRRSDREDEVLEIMEQREALELRAKEARAASDAQRAEVERVGADTAIELRQVTADLDIRRAERQAIVPGIDPEVLELYEELRSTKKGVGAAALVDGVCQGCHETLSAVELDRVKRSDGDPAVRALPADPGPVNAAPDLVIHCDGASRGNPGPAGAGAWLTDGDGTTVAEIAEGLGETTNNVAEYTAAILGLERAAELGARTVLLRSDSQLLVHQLTGRYRVKTEHLQPLFRRVRALAAGFDRVTFEHVPREANVEADRLANAGVDAWLAGRRG